MKKGKGKKKNCSLKHLMFEVNEKYQLYKKVIMDEFICFSYYYQ